MDTIQSENLISQKDAEMYEDNLSSDFECNSSEIPDDLEEISSNLGEVQSAQLKFEEICESIDEEEKRLQDLEERRKKLELDMERLQQEIEKEKVLFREAIDAEIAKKREMDLNPQELKEEKFYYMPKIDPLNVNREEVESKLKEYRDAMEESQMQPIQAYEDDEELKRLKSNLATYKKALGDSSKDKLLKQKRKAAAKIFQRHLDEVDLKCSEQIGKIATIQRSIENIGISGEGNSGVAKNE